MQTVVHYTFEAWQRLIRYNLGLHEGVQELYRGVLSRHKTPYFTFDQCIT